MTACRELGCRRGRARPRPTGILRLLALLGLVVEMGSGCITKHSGVDGDAVAWREGETTRQAVVAVWGNPSKIKGDMWIWRDWQLLGSKVKASYMMIGLTVANARASTREYQLTFDASGVLVAQKVVDSVPMGVRWSPWPWY